MNSQQIEVPKEIVESLELLKKVMHEGWCLLSVNEQKV